MNAFYKYMFTNEQKTPKKVAEKQVFIVEGVNFI